MHGPINLRKSGMFVFPYQHGTNSRLYKRVFLLVSLMKMLLILTARLTLMGESEELC